jgi:outer membrane protein OmpA-like peptidoglycan-associated protein
MGRFILLFAVVLINLSGNAQNRSHFGLSDTAFTVGAAFSPQCPVLFDFNGHNDVRPESYSFLDSFANFMLAHPELIIEVSSFTDQRGHDSSNLKLSQVRANMVKKHLEQHGVNPFSLIAIGYGEQFPLVSQAQIDTAKTSARERLYQQNRRTEFKILHVYPGTFTMNDSAFTVGDVMRLNVIYDLSKASIQSHSCSLLDSLADFLIHHPELTVEISAHTDSRGSDKYSFNLSDARAHAVFDYLAVKGVSKNNMKYAGYAHRKPLVPTTQVNKAPSKEGQEQLHQLNRRTEIRITQINR